MQRGGLPPLMATWIYSFRARLLLGVLVPVVLIQIIGVGLELLEMRKHKFEEAVAEGQMTARITGEGLKEPLIEGDFRSVRLRLEAMLAYGVATHVQLHRADGSLLHEVISQEYDGT